MQKCSYPLTLSLNWRAAAWAGIAAGTAATVAEITLWLALPGNDMPFLFQRDARLAAAIVMGQDILTASAGWQVMLAATFVHFTLSIAYAFVLGCLVARLGTATALLTGIAYGLALYAINMHVFILLFPWFAADRDWITVAAHAVFGGTAAACYKALARGGMP